MKNKIISLAQESGAVLLITSLMLFMTAQPHFYHGIIDFFETGLYLTDINQTLRSQVAYADFLVLRGPLEILFPALLMKVFGVSIKILFGYFYIANVLTIIFAIFVARKILSNCMFTHLLILVLIANTISTVYYKYWGGLRFTLGMISISFVLEFLYTKRRRWLFYTGLTATLAFLFSPEMGIFSIAACVFTLFLFEQEDLIRNLIALFFGSLCILLPFLGYLLINGTTLDYIINTYTTIFTTSRVYHYDILFPDIPRNPISALKYVLNPSNKNFIYALPAILYLSFGSYFIKLSLSKKVDGITPRIFCVWAYGLFMYLGSFRQLNGPQFLMGMQVAFILVFFIIEKGAVLFRKVEEQGSVKLHTKIFSLSSIAIIFFITYFSIFTVKNNLSYAMDLRRVVFRQTSRGAFPSGTQMKALKIKRGDGILLPDWQADEINGVVNFIEKNTVRDDIVFSFPDQGTYNFLTDRAYFSRFTLFDMAAYRPEWTSEFFFLFEKQKPRIVICTNEKDAFEPLLYEYPIVKNREKVRRILKQDYILKTTFGHIDIYELKK